MLDDGTFSISNNRNQLCEYRAFTAYAITHHDFVKTAHIRHFFFFHIIDFVLALNVDVTELGLQ